MELLNFGHPLSADTLEELKDHGVTPEEVQNIRVQLDMEQPLAPQISQIIDGIPRSPDQWATEPALVNLPGAAIAAGLVVAELHGRSGSFPRVLSLLRGEDGVFRLGQLIDLQSVRDEARKAR